MSEFLLMIWGTFCPFASSRYDSARASRAPSGYVFVAEIEIDREISFLGAKKLRRSETSPSVRQQLPYLRIMRPSLLIFFRSRGSAFFSSLPLYICPQIAPFHK